MLHIRLIGTHTNITKHRGNKHLQNKVLELRQLTRQEESPVHRELFSKSDMAEVFLAFAYGDDFATLPEDLHDELLCGVLGQTADKHRLTPWRAFPHSWRWKVCSKAVEQRREKTVQPSLGWNIKTWLDNNNLNYESVCTCIHVEIIQLENNGHSMLRVNYARYIYKEYFQWRERTVLITD